MKEKYDYSSDDSNSDNCSKNKGASKNLYDLNKLKNVNLDYCFKVNTSSKIEGQMKNIDRQELNRTLRIKDRADRATVEQVIDARISRILFKLINKGEITEINGCISTGKEANVYYAKGSNGKELALKIYKTSILIFKDRDRYISGEFRFRHGYCRGNPRKMVALWAEKEVRNLKRLQLAGIDSPVPLILKSNLIIMEFIGKESNAAPRLKDAEIESAEEWEEIYLKIILILRKLFKECKLVHADFSEYNLLYYEKKVYVIDVAQAVEDFHPNALSFLKRDCHNVNMYFEKNGVNTITDQQLFDIVSGFDKIENLEIILQKYQEENSEKTKANKKFKEIENGLFINFEIPRSLQEEDVDKITSNFEIEEALTKLCGVVKKENEKELYVPKRNENGKIVDAFQKTEKSKRKKGNDIKENNNDLKTKEVLNQDLGSENNIENDNPNEDNFEGKKVEEEDIHDKDDQEDDNSDDYLSFDENIDSNEKEIDENGELQDVKKNKNFDPFEGLSKQERKKKVKAENKEKRANKKMTKYEKNKAIKKTSGKR